MMNCCGALQQLVTTDDQVLQLFVSNVDGHSCAHSTPIACTLLCTIVVREASWAISTALLCNLAFPLIDQISDNFSTLLVLWKRNCCEQATSTACGSEQINQPQAACSAWTMYYRQIGSASTSSAATAGWQNWLYFGRLCLMTHHQACKDMHWMMRRTASCRPRCILGQNCWLEIDGAHMNWSQAVKIITTKAASWA